MAAEPVRAEPVLHNGRGQNSERPAYRKKKKKSSLGLTYTLICIKSLDGNKISWQQWSSLGRIGNLGTGEGQQFFTAVFGTYECIIYSKHKIEIKDCVVVVVLWYAGLSLLWPLPPRSTGSGRAGPAAMTHGPSRSAACGTPPDRGTNPRPPHRQADSQPPRHQGSPSFPPLSRP